jgi:ABC-type cobalt transport system substrate-binding protein
MKTELMALALLFAFIGFVNSQIVPSDAFPFSAALSNAASSNGAPQLGIDPLWKPTPEIQALLFGLQAAAIGCAMVAYFMRHMKKSSDPERD